MAKKKTKAGAPPKGRGPQTPPEATHFAVPIVVFQGILKVLETMPYAQVSPLMAALQQCQPLSIPAGAQPGAMIPGLSRTK